jgi:hypothetical protein
VEQTGGSDEIRDLGLIKSGLNRGFATFDGVDLYKEVEKGLIFYGLLFELDRSRFIVK